MGNLFAIILLLTIACLCLLPLVNALRLSDRIRKYRKQKNFNLGRLLSLIPDQSAQIEFLQNLRILPTGQKCEKCSKATGDSIMAQKLVIPENNHYVHFRCSKCSTKISIRKGTFMYSSKLSFRRFTLLAYSFCRWTWTYDQTIQETCLTSEDETEDEETNKQKNTLDRRSGAKVYRFFRNVISDHLLNNQQLHGRKIGGPLKTVEIDESLFGKR